jgi:hypothetical protein
MNTVTLLLAVLAVASLAQAVSLVILFWQGRRVLQGLEETGGRLGEGLLPTVENLTRTTESLADSTAIAAAQLREADRVITALGDKVAEARDVVDEMMVPSAVKAVALAAAVKIVRRGFSALRRRG